MMIQAVLGNPNHPEYLQKIPRYRDNGSSTSNLYSVQ